MTSSSGGASGGNSLSTHGECTRGHKEARKPLSFLDIKELLQEAHDPERAQTPKCSGSAHDGGSASGPPSPDPAQPPAIPRLQSALYTASIRTSSNETAPQPLPVQDLSEHQQLRLQKRCSKALHLLERLQQQSFSRKQGGFKELLPPAALRFCKGLAFVWERKVGLMAGWDWGSGFVMQRFPSGEWSAPCFVKMRYASFGFILGALKLEGCHVLQSVPQVLEFAQPRGTCTFDCTFPIADVDFDTLSADGPMKTLRHHDGLAVDPESRHVAMLSDGLIYDLSLRAGLAYANDSYNAELYGHGVTPEQILAGEVATPPQFQPLYQALSQLAGEAQVVRRAVSKFELARQRSKLYSGRSLSKGEGRSVSWRSASDREQYSTGGSRTGASSPTGGSPHVPVEVLPTSAQLGSFKLFGDAEIDFHEEHTYEQQEAEDHGAAAGHEGVAQQLEQQGRPLGESGT